MADERLLSEDEAALVFRRAAELDAQSPGHHGDETGFDVATLERIAADAGLSPAAVRQAVAELHTGRLPAIESGRGRTRPAVPSSVVVERRMAVPAGTVASRLETYLRSQTFRICRRRGTLTTWEPGRGLAANLMRGIDVADRVRLRRVDGLEVLVEAEGDARQRSHVRIVLDLSTVHRNARNGTIAGGVLGAAGVVAGAAGVVLGAPEVLLALPATTGSGAGAYFGSRSTYSKHVKRAVDAIELVLDELEHGPSR